MFPRHLRLSREEIDKVIKSGVFKNSAFFSVKTTQNQDKSVKSAFVISKKEEKSSVLRNKAKRRARVAFRRALEQVLAKKVVIFLKKQAITAPIDDMVSEFNRILS